MLWLRQVMSTIRVFLISIILADNGIARLKKEIELIKKRNRKVEADKAWETSKFRAASIVVMTFLIAVVVMYLIDVKDYWSNALIPTIGFYLSVQTLPFLKRWWIKNRYP
jgi:hypothetical protein